MKQTLEQLIKLQEIDQRLLEIKEHMGDLPVTVETQELEVASLQSDNEQKEIRIGEIEKEIRHHESEDVQLKFEEEKTEFEENIKLNTNKIATTSDSLTSNRADLQSALVETTQEKEELESNRSIIFDKIESSLLNTYETLRNARDGVGLVSIIGRACGGCYSQLPPQTVIEIKENNKIITCPNCSVLQFWDGAEE
jgi:predicted  nucleic acid-binding Zn-ribbon protein